MSLWFYCVYYIVYRGPYYTGRRAATLLPPQQKAPVLWLGDALIDTLSSGAKQTR